MPIFPIIVSSDRISNWITITSISCNDKCPFGISDCYDPPQLPTHYYIYLEQAELFTYKNQWLMMSRVALP